VIPGLPYRRLSAFYFFYFAVIGILVPYWPMYLASLGYGATDIGLLLSIIMATKIVAPNIWGWLADHYGHRMAIIRWGSFLALVSFTGIFFRTDFLWLVLVTACYSFFWNAVLSQFEVVTLDYLKEKPEIYSRVRLWGSVGFIVAVSGTGLLLDYISLDWIAVFLMVSLACIWASSLLVTESGHHYVEAGEGSIFSVLRQPEVICFFIVCLLMQVSHGPYYTFFSLYLESFEYSKTEIGMLWALGVLAEVVLFWYMHRIMPHFGLRFMILLSLFATSLRWLLLAWFVDVLWIVLFAQCLHAFSFGSFHAVAIELVRRFFTVKHAGRGQALYSSLSFGAGSALGAFGSGLLWDWNHHYTFLIASVVSMVAFLLALWFIRLQEHDAAAVSGR
jgi:PPP family 3-phenylpropionic acid transporter